MPKRYKFEQFTSAGDILGKLSRHCENPTPRLALRCRIRHTLGLVQTTDLLVEDEEVAVLASTCQVTYCEDKDIKKKPRNTIMICFFLLFRDLQRKPQGIVVLEVELRVSNKSYLIKKSLHEYKSQKFCFLFRELR